MRDILDGKNSLTSGFTIVELLIIIVVIAVLAAISIVTYNGIQNRAHDTAVQADLRNIGNKIQIYALDGSGLYPFAATTSDLRAELAGLDFKPTKAAYRTDGSSGNVLYITNNGSADFLMMAKSKSGKNFYYSNREGAVKEYSGNFPVVGAAAVRTALLGPTAVNAGANAYGYGEAGWVSQWIH